MKHSAGIILYRKQDNQLEFLLVCPGGPFYKKPIDGIWTFPKGESKPDELEEETARREFEEETGITITEKLFHLGSIRQRKNKTTSAFYCEKDIDLSTLKSAYFEMEYPKNSGKTKRFLEIQQAKWCSIEEVKIKIVPKLYPFFQTLIQHLSIK